MLVNLAKKAYKQVGCDATSVVCTHSTVPLVKLRSIEVNGRILFLLIYKIQFLGAIMLLLVRNQVWRIHKCRDTKERSKSIVVLFLRVKTRNSI